MSVAEIPKSCEFPGGFAFSVSAHRLGEQKKRTRTTNWNWRPRNGVQPKDAVRGAGECQMDSGAARSPEPNLRYLCIRWVSDLQQAEAIELLHCIPAEELASTDWVMPSRGATFRSKAEETEDCWRLTETADSSHTMEKSNRWE